MGWRIDGVASALPSPTTRASITQMKGHEDMLDAVVCAWVGICAIEGRCVPFGDEESAIWVPAA
jgi:predicted RNase H-like nuclease